MSLFLLCYKMSATLFRSKQYKSKKNLRALMISLPVLSNSSSSVLEPLLLKHAVVLRALYDFQAEGECELLVSQGQYLLLVDKPGDGWLGVQIIEGGNAAARGLVPASYVEIEVNDVVNPVSTEWLQDTSPLSTRERPQAASCTVDNTIDDTSPRASATTRLASSARSSTSLLPKPAPESPAPSPAMPPPPSDDDFFFRAPSVPPSPTGSTAIRSVAITHVLQHDNRYYYRIDALLETKRKFYVKKTYQDFYNLHINLLVLNTTLQLPKLPQPIRQQTKALLLIRCNELNVYLNKLLRNPAFRQCDELSQWMGVTPQLMMETMSDDDINQILLPDAIDVFNQHATKTKYSPTAPMPPAPQPLPKINTLPAGQPLRGPSAGVAGHLILNMKYTSYMNQKTDRADVKATLQPLRLPHLHSSNTLELYGSLIDRYDAQSTVSSSTSVHKHGEEHEDAEQARQSSSSDSDSLFSELKQAISPTTPVMGGSKFGSVSVLPITPTEQGTLEFIKVKVVLNNQEEDIIALKVERKEMRSISDLKRAVSEKIYRDPNLTNHYSFRLGTVVDENEILQTLQRSNKVYLTLVRR